MLIIKKAGDKMRDFWRAFLLAKNQWGRRIVAGLAMLFDTGSLIVIPLILKHLFDSFTTDLPVSHIMREINRGVSLLIILAFLRFGINYLAMYFQEATGNHISHDIRKLLFGRILRFPFRFFDTRQTGDLMSILTRDVDAVRDGTGFVIMLVIVNVLTVIGMTIAMLRLHSVLALIVLAIFPFLGVLARWYSRNIGPLYRSLQRQSGDLHTVAQENISGIRVVKAFGRQQEEQEKFNQENTGLYKTSLRIAYLSSKVHPTLDFLGMLSSTIALAAGGYFVIKGEISFGTLVAFTAYSESLVWPIRNVGWLTEMFQRAIAGAKRIYEIIDEEERLVEKQQPFRDVIQGNVVFDNVSFTYPNGEEAIRNFSLKMEKGQTVCLLGMTGSGKTTIANLLPRFYDPSEGRITIDEVDIRDWDLASLREQIGFVFQDNFLFSATLRDNITMGKDFTDEQIDKAIAAAQARKFIQRLPKGLDTLVGERGIGLSGGERQRVAIARAILLDPQILIFDDSSASLDMRTEAALQKALDELYENRTVLVIAQRVTTAERADHIILLDAGEIIEQGTHQELLAKNGIYTELHRIQSANMSLTTSDEEVDFVG